VNDTTESVNDSSYSDDAFQIEGEIANHVTPTYQNRGANLPFVPFPHKSPLPELVMSDHLNLSAKLPSLRIAIIGAGIGGLSASIALRRVGFEHVSVYEQAAIIAEVGAGIQVAPNLSRLLRRWGCLDRLEKDAIGLKGNSIRRFEDDTEIGSSSFMPQVEEAYGAPLWVVHRADLQRTLLEYAKELGVNVRTGSHVEEVDFNVQEDEDNLAQAQLVRSPRILLKNRDQAEGKWVEADVIIAADGIRSGTRMAMMKRQGTEDHGGYSTSVVFVVLAADQRNI
jgi:salicylate hydroxylase